MKATLEFVPKISTMYIENQAVLNVVTQRLESTDKSGYRTVNMLMNVVYQGQGQVITSHSIGRMRLLGKMAAILQTIF